MDKSGAKTGQSAYGDEKPNCQCENRTKEIDSPCLQNSKLQVGTENGKRKWDTKMEDMKRRWAMKKEDMKEKLRYARDDVISKLAIKGRDRSPVYARLIEKEKEIEKQKAIENEKAREGVEMDGNKTSSKSIRGKKMKSREYKRHTRAALAGNTDAAIMAGVVSLAILFTV